MALRCQTCPWNIYFLMLMEKVFLQGYFWLCLPYNVEASPCSETQWYWFQSGWKIWPQWHGRVHLPAGLPWIHHKSNWGGQKYNCQDNSWIDGWILCLENKAQIPRKVTISSHLFCGRYHEGYMPLVCAVRPFIQGKECGLCSHIALSSNLVLPHLGYLISELQLHKKEK